MEEDTYQGLARRVRRLEAEVNDQGKRLRKAEKELALTRLVILGGFIILVVGIYAFKGAFAELVEVVNDTVVLDGGPAVYRPWENPLKAEQLSWLKKGGFFNETNYKLQ